MRRAGGRVGRPHLLDPFTRVSLCGIFCQEVRMKRETDKGRVTAYVGEEDKARAEKAARQDGRTLSQWVGRLVKAALEAKR